MARYWHIEHADGREWTEDELQSLAERLCSEGSIAPYDELFQRAAVDGFGCPWLMCDYRDYPVGDEPDMEVVWDG